MSVLHIANTGHATGLILKPPSFPHTCRMRYDTTTLRRNRATSPLPLLNPFLYSSPHPLLHNPPRCSPSTHTCRMEYDTTTLGTEPSGCQLTHDAEREALLGSLKTVTVFTLGTWGEGGRRRCEGQAAVVNLANCATVFTLGGGRCGREGWGSSCCCGQPCRPCGRLHAGHPLSHGWGVQER